MTRAWHPRGPRRRGGRPPTADGLFRLLGRRHPPDELYPVRLAHDLAVRAHRGQRRANGDPYLTHPVAVAIIVAQLGGTLPAVSAALLHDVVEDAAYPAEWLRLQFGEHIAGLVGGLQPCVARLRSAARTSPEPPGRCPPPGDRDQLVLALADRLHNMRTLQFLPPEKRQRTSLDTLAVHVPPAGSASRRSSGS